MVNNKYFVPMIGNLKKIKMVESLLPHDTQNKGDGSNKKVKRFTVLIPILYQSGYEIHFFLGASCWFQNILK